MILSHQNTRKPKGCQGLISCPTLAVCVAFALASVSYQESRFSTGFSSELSGMCFCKFESQTETNKNQRKRTTYISKYVSCHTKFLNVTKFRKLLNYPMTNPPPLGSSIFIISKTTPFSDWKVTTDK